MRQSRHPRRRGYWTGGRGSMITWGQLLSNELLDVLPAHGEEVHVLAVHDEAHQALGEELSGAELELFHPQVRHAVDDVLAPADMGSLVGTDEVAHVLQDRVVAPPGLVD